MLLFYQPRSGLSTLLPMLTRGNVKIRSCNCNDKNEIVEWLDVLTDKVITMREAMECRFAASHTEGQYL